MLHKLLLLKYREATRHQSLEDTIRIITSSNRLQFLLVLRPVSRKYDLEPRRVTPIEVIFIIIRFLKNKEGTKLTCI